MHTVAQLTIATKYRQLLAARRNAEDADRNLATAATEAAAQRARLETLESDYRNTRTDHAA